MHFHSVKTTAGEGGKYLSLPSAAEGGLYLTSSTWEGRNLKCQAGCCVRMAPAFYHVKQLTEWVLIGTRRTGHKYHLNITHKRG